MSLVFVDCEAWGGCPSVGQLTEFGAVIYENMKTFHGILVNIEPDPDNPAIRKKSGRPTPAKEKEVATKFYEWLSKNANPPYVFVSDNNGYDWQWINDLFWRTLGMNPFGHSSRRISDFYAGLCKDFHQTQKWKRWRVTPHSHIPTEDALGNVEAFRTMLKEFGINHQ